MKYRALFAVGFFVGCVVPVSWWVVIFTQLSGLIKSIILVVAALIMITSMFISSKEIDEPFRFGKIYKSRWKPKLKRFQHFGVLLLGINTPIFMWVVFSIIWSKA
ncbi:hypothetical protein QT397_10285 [Microbulbifer sp. MKSA007]|nr:hypothetical protein QT397_10285 [Microbulbifer sp. MKSA007]